jgi:hypothetical protein
VGDDDIETFKREWTDKHHNQPALKTGSSDAVPSASSASSASFANPVESNQ